MAFALVAHGGTFGTTSNGYTSGTFDTTGADLLVVVAGAITSATATITDSKSNTWTALTERAGSFTDRYSRIWYAWNPTVGSAHTFTVAGTGNYPGFAMSAWSGSQTASDPFDQQNGATAYGTTLATGSITPSVANELLIAGFYTDQEGTASTIDSSFTVQDSVIDTGFGHGNTSLASQIQTTATARNPTWTNGMGSSDRMIATIASFKAVAAGASAPIGKLVRLPQAVNRASRY